jgi:hypothetical protein
VPTTKVRSPCPLPPGALATTPSPHARRCSIGLRDAVGLRPALSARPHPLVPHGGARPPAKRAGWLCGPAEFPCGPAELLCGAEWSGRPAEGPCEPCRGPAREFHPEAQSHPWAGRIRVDSATRVQAEHLCEAAGRGGGRAPARCGPQRQRARGCGGARPAAARAARPSALDKMDGEQAPFPSRFCNYAPASQSREELLFNPGHRPSHQGPRPDGPRAADVEGRRSSLPRRDLDI